MGDGRGMWVVMLVTVGLLAGGEKGGISGGIERRIDETDGNAYTYEEFVEYYGGEEEWKYSEREASKTTPQLPIIDLNPSLNPDTVNEKTIWGYWADGEENMPDFYKLCVQTWRIQNPFWDVVLLNKGTVLKYLSKSELPPKFQKMKPHGASDHIRLGLLAKYGGVWLDVSILLRESMDSIAWGNIEEGSAEFVGTYNPIYGSAHLGNRDFVESWFLATKRHNPFIFRWRDLLLELFHERVDSGFGSSLLSHDLYKDMDLSNFLREGVDFREYLAIHVMLRRILETEKDLRKLWEHSWKLYSTKDTGRYLYAYVNIIYKYIKSSNNLKRQIHIS
ncbi:hypothetical protein AAMO2058_001403700 [Amorphochlora amoebiformis]